MELKVLLENLERELASAEVRSDASRMSTLLSDDFEEVGTSGRRYFRQDVLDSVGHLNDALYELSDFSFLELARTSVLVKYKALLNGQPTRRSSIWICRDGAWQMCYHQSSSVAE